MLLTPRPPLTSRHLAFAVLALSLLSYVMQFGMISVALHTVIVEIDAPLRWGGWILTIFMVGQVISLSVSGRLADRFGPRAVFASGLSVFAASSLACAAAPNVYLLIVARLLQGLGGGALMPSGMSLIAEIYSDNRAKAVGLYSSILPFGAVIGPTLGGFIVERAGWRWTFLLNVPLGVLATVLVFTLLPRGARKPPQPVDVRGVALIATMITAVIFMLTELGRQEASLNPIALLASGVIGLVSAVLLVHQERRVSTPALDIELLRRREFLVTNSTAFVSGLCWIGVFSMVPLYVQTAYGISETASGTLMAPRAAIMAGVSMLAALVLLRTGYRRPIFVGLLVMAGSLGLLALGLHDPTFAGVRLDSFWWLLLVVCLAGAARGMTNPSLINAGMDLAPDRIASVTGLRAMFQSFGGTVGIALMVMLASRSGDVASGMQFGFGLFALLLVGAAVLSRWIPELPSEDRSIRPDETLAPSATR